MRDAYFITAYYVAFGPHGPRAPVNPPGTAVKIITGISALVGSAALLYGGIRSLGMLFPSIFSSYRVHITCPPFFFLENHLRPKKHSTTATQDHQQGVGGGQQRACEGTQNQPHLRSVTPSYTSFDRMLSFCLRSGDGMQVSHRRVTLARASSRTSRFPSMAVEHGACPSCFYQHSLSCLPRAPLCRRIYICIKNKFPHRLCDPYSTAGANQRKLRPVTGLQHRRGYSSTL
jgi:hypothetical protein